MKRLSAIKSYINVIYWLLLMCIAVILALIIYNVFPFLVKHWLVTITTIISIIGSLLTLKDISKRFQKFFYKSNVILRKDRKCTRLNSCIVAISYVVFCL